MDGWTDEWMSGKQQLPTADSRGELQQQLLMVNMRKHFTVTLIKHSNFHEQNYLPKVFKWDDTADMKRKIIQMHQWFCPVCSMFTQYFHNNAM